jgi:hypothetical protein
MTSPIFLLAPGPNINFGTAPSGASYVSNGLGLITITNGAVADEAALISAGCTALYPAGQTLMTVATLPAPAIAGQRQFVSDSTAAASGNFGAVVTGGGANMVPVYSDGAGWRIG